MGTNLTPASAVPSAEALVHFLTCLGVNVDDAISMEQPQRYVHVFHGVTQAELQTRSPEVLIRLRYEYSESLKIQFDSAQLPELVLTVSTTDQEITTFLGSGITSSARWT